jgi:hypothetical protein
MILTLDVVLVILKVVFVLALVALLFLAIDLAVYEYVDREKRRAHSKALAVENAKRVVATLKRQAQLRVQAEKAAMAKKLFEEEPYDLGFCMESGFDSEGRLLYRGTEAPSEPNWEFYKKIDAVVDSQIFENTEEL